jgi:hypothetical protein
VPIIAYPLDPSTSIAERKESIHIYRIDREKSSSNTKKGVESQYSGNPDPKWKIDDWLRFAEETFSSPSKRERGEKGPVPVVDDANNKKGFTLLEM